MPEKKTVSTIIVAAGSGLRMKTPTRKQYLSIESGRPILAMTLAAFDLAEHMDTIYLVAPETDMDFCANTIVSPLGLKTPVNLVPGGARRQDSVYNGLKAIDNPDGVVLIHDGVRPFVETEQILACIDEARASGACILGVPATDTLKQTDPDGHIEQTLDRKRIWLAQTPQAFQYGLILKAHEAARRDGYKGTDDASLVERLGRKVRIIPGNRRNIKITTPEDLAIAGAIIQMSAGNPVPCRVS